MIRVLIVEDEPLARERLQECLRQESDVEVVRTCVDGRSAVRAIRDLAPDLVFLDVQIPELNGFGVLREVSRYPREPPLVVIVTAYGEYALQGFEVNALDYLLKPFDDVRFRETMRRVRQKLERERERSIPRQVVDAIDRLWNAGPEASHMPGESHDLARLVVREGRRVFFVKLEEIHWIEAAGNYARAHLRGSSHLIRTSLKDLETRLPASRFARIHRGIIVNIERVKEIQPHLHGDYHVLLENGTVLRMSRRYRGLLLS
jgi:two-component system LytT family response regulator